MRFRTSIAVLLLALIAIPAFAQDQIGQFRNASGQRVNLQGVVTFDAAGNVISAGSDASEATLQVIESNTDGLEGSATSTATNTGTTATNSAALTRAQGSTTSGQTGPIVQGAVSTAAPTYTTAQTNPISLDVKGATRVLNMDATGAPIDYTAAVTTAVQEKQTFSTAIVGLAPAVSATDLVCITGSASKTVRIVRFQISGVATAAGAYAVVIAKRSTANSAGTAMTEVPLDSNNSAASAVAESYTAVPTPGTLVGNVAARRITVSTGAGAIPIVVNEFEFGANGRQALILRGVAQQACINLNAVTMTGGLLDITAQWTEE